MATEREASNQPPWGKESLLYFNQPCFILQVKLVPAVRVPDAVTPQQAASGQTAIMYPSAHAHALGQMVRVSS